MSVATTSRRTRGRSVRLVAIAAGGAVGSLLRFGLLATSMARSALVLLAINVIGSFVLGVASVMLGRDRLVYSGVGVGFCGGFTSLSAFAVSVVDSGRVSGAVAATSYTIATVSLCVTAAFAGHRFGRRPVDESPATDIGEIESGLQP